MPSFPRRSSCAARAALLLAIPLACASASFAQARWTRWEQLHARVDHAMVYDPGAPRVLLLGGTRWESVYGAFDALWEFRGGRWSHVAPTPPMPRPSAVWDVGRNELFAVADRGDSRSALLRWDGNQWHAIGAPVEVLGAASLELAHDPSANATLLLATHIAPARVDVLQWNGTSFALRSSGSGPGWGDFRCVYDAPRQRLLAIGSEWTGILLEAWSYTGTTWQRLVTTNPPPARIGAAVTYDPYGAAPLVLCGSEAGNARDDGWWLQGLQWQPAPALGVAPARQRTSAAGDLATGNVVLFGGGRSGAQGLEFLGDTVVSQGATWVARDLARSLDARFLGATAQDSGRRRMFALSWRGGVTTADENDGSGWHSTALVGAAPPFESPAVYDPRSGVVVIVDGGGTTWLWDGVRMTLAATGLPTSGNRALAWDGTTVLLVEGGSIGVAPAIWFWDGQSWSPGSGAQIPPGGFAPRLVHDERLALVSLFYENVYGGPTYHHEWNGARWTRSASTHPGRRRFVVGYHPARGRVVLAGGETWDPQASRETPHRDALEYDRGIWRPIAFLPTPASDFYLGGALVATPDDSLVWLGAQDRGSHVALESYRLVSTDPAAITAFGDACGGASGIPRFVFRAWQRPVLGEIFPVAATGLPATATHATLIYGLRRDVFGTVALPLDLGPAGFRGCSLYTSIDALRVLPLQAGAAAWIDSIPSQPALLGAEIFEQVFAHDPTANPGGAVMTGGLELRLGRR